jgi:uncharacterized protein (DUF302 family)
MKIDVPYGITRRLESIDLPAARTRITAALQKEGFGVLTEIDVQATFEKKLGVRVDPYVILGACNPNLARAALDSEPGLGLLLPCNVVLTADGDGVVLSAASPKALFAIAGEGAGREQMRAIAEDAEARIRRAVAAA